MSFLPLATVTRVDSWGGGSAVEHSKGRSGAIDENSLDLEWISLPFFLFPTLALHMYLLWASADVYRASVGARYATAAATTLLLMARRSHTHTHIRTHARTHARARTRAHAHMSAAALTFITRWSQAEQ